MQFDEKIKFSIKVATSYVRTKRVLTVRPRPQKKGGWKENMGL